MMYVCVCAWEEHRTIVHSNRISLFLCSEFTWKVSHTRLVEQRRNNRDVQIWFPAFFSRANRMNAFDLINHLNTVLTEQGRAILWLFFSSSFRNNCYVYPLDHHHHHHSHSHIRCNCDSTTTYNEQATTTTRQSTHSPCPLFNNSPSRFKKRQQEKSQFERYLFSWKTMAILFLLTTLCFLTSTIYLSMMRYYHPTFRETNHTQSKNRLENIFYGWCSWSVRIRLILIFGFNSRQNNPFHSYWW